MENLNRYEKLYKLQDKVLNIVNSLENEFYLTGGTALHRFYYNFRYSEDLDFFMSYGRNFREDVDEILKKIDEYGLEYKLRPLKNYKLSESFAILV